MAKSGRAKDGDNVSVTSANFLVERQPADGSHKSDNGPLQLKTTAGADDKSFANIHTGDRITHQSVQMSYPAGSPALATAAAAVGASPSTGSAPGYNAVASQVGEARGSTSAATSRSDSAAADIAPLIGSGSPVARVGSHAGESTQHVAGAGVPSLRGASGNDSLSTHAGGGGGGGGGGGANHEHDGKVTDAPLVHAPKLTVLAAVGAEDHAIPLDIRAGSADSSHAETLFVTIAGVPDGATLSAGIHNADGTWTLTSDQLAELTLTPAPDSGEDFTLTITVLAHDNVTGVEAAAVAHLPVTVVDTVIVPDLIPAVSPPSLAVSAAVGTENTAIALAINANLIDIGYDEALTIVIGGLPEGATLSAGVHNSDGRWTLTGDQLAGLTLTPAADSGEDFTLTVTATATDSITGVEATATTQFPVTVIDNAVVQAPDTIPSVAAPSLAVSAAVGMENSTIPLAINAGLTDLAGAEALTVTIGGLPEGATLSAGVHNSDGSWTLTGDQLAGLTLTPAADSGEDFTLTVTATAIDSITGVEATATTQLPVTVIDAVEIAAPSAIPAVTAPSLAVSAAVGAENGTIPLVINTSLTDLAGSEALTVTIGGLPVGATLSAGTQNLNGSWMLTGDQLAGLRLTPAPDSGEDFTLTVIATATDSITGVEATATTQLPVTVIDNAVVQAPEAISSVTAPSLSVSAAVGTENGTIPLAIDAGLVDLAGNETLTVTIGGLPEGATLSAGTQNPDGSWTLSGDQLAGLALMPAADSGEDFTLTVTATAIDSITGVEATATTQLPVTVIDTVEIAAPSAIPAVTAPSLAASAAVGTENGTIPILIAAGLTDLVGNGVLTITIGGLPEGATLSVGTQNSDGSWTLTGDQLTGLTLIPAADSSEDFALTVIATATDSITGVEASASTQLPVTVIDNIMVQTPDAIPSVTAPSLAVSAAVGAENGTILLVIDAGLLDLASNETLTVTIGGLPEGAMLSAGVHNSDGTWTLTGDQLAELTLTPAPDSGEDIILTITAIARDEVTGVEAAATTQLPVTVIDAIEIAAPSAIPAVTAPSLAVSAAVGTENGTIPILIAAGLTDLVGNGVLTITIGGLPEGATLSAGTQNPDGSWMLTGDQLAGLTLTPAPDSGEDFTLTVTATAIDSITGVEATATTQLPVTIIDAVEIAAPSAIPAVTPPSLAVWAAVGAENGTIPLVINTGLTDLTGSEALTVTIGGLPEGAMLSAGTQNPDGSWTLTGDQLTGLTLTPAADSGEDFTLTVTATAIDSITGVEATATTQLPVTVIDTVEIAAPSAIPAVTAPSLAVSAAVGAENGTIPLAINAGLIDLAGNETLTVTVGGLPEGATLSAGTQNPDGTWMLTGDQLAGLTLTPAADSGEDFTLTVTATAIDSITGVEATATTQLPVTVIDAVEIAAPSAIPAVTAPSLAVSAAVGAENSTIPLAIGAGLVALAGNETLTVTIGGLPEGATLSNGVHNTDGSWTLTGDQLAGLTLTPAADSGEDFTLTVTATAIDSITGMEATATTQLPVTVIDTVEIAAPSAVPAVVAPSLAVSAAVGAENGTFPLAINAGLTDLTGSDTLTVTVGGLPEGAALSAGTQNPDGSWTLTGDQLTGLTLTPAANSGEDFILTVTATAIGSVTGVEATASTQLPVTVIDNVVVQAPDAISSVTAPSLAVAAAVGTENATIPLVIDAGLADLTGSDTLTVTVGGLPEGAMLSVGTQNPDGTWTLTGDQLTGLTLTPAADSGEDFTLTVTATAIDSITGIEATASTQLPVTVIDNVVVQAPDAIPSVTAPSLAVSAAVGTENSTIPLVIGAGLVDLASNETLTVTIGGMPEDATLSAGTQNPDGSWTLTGDQLTGLTLTPAADSGEDFTLTVTATAIDSITGVEATATTQLPVTVIDTMEIATPATIPAVTAPSLAVSAAVGAENGTIPLAINAGLTDLAGNETLTVAIGGLPEGAMLSVGMQNLDGTWTLTGDQLTGLTPTPAADSGEDFTLTVTAMATDSITGVQATTSTQLPVTVIDSVTVQAPYAIPSVTAPSLAASAAAGLEDQPIPLDIHTALDGMETSGEFLVAIGNLPAGAVLSAGTAAPDGAWIVGADQLEGLTLLPSLNMSGPFTLSVAPITVGADEVAVAGTTKPLVVDVQGLADIPTFSVNAATGLENTPIPLTIAAGLSDIDGSESLMVTVAGLPEEAALSAGAQSPDGTWTLTDNQLAGLTLIPAADTSGNFILTVTATAHEAETDSTASTTYSLPVTVIDVLDAPTLSVIAASGLEDTAIPLAITAGLVDLSPTTTLSVAIDGLPEGATLSAGTHSADGSYVLTRDELAGLSITPAPNWGEDFTLDITATAHDSLTGSDTVATASLPVNVIDVLDAPTLSVTAASGLEGTAIPIAITAGLVDLSPTTTLSVVIDGLPEGATLSAGTQNTDGTWALTGEQLAGLTLTPALDSSEDFTLGITTTAHDSLTNSDVVTTASLPVEVIDVVDAPSLVPADDTTTGLTDAEFLQALESLSSPTSDTSSVGFVLDPVLSATTSDLSADTTMPAVGMTEAIVVQETMVVASEPPPPPPPPDPTTTISFTTPTL
ncbi:hypothetical protein V1281_000388 [Nitrobacteraceae bacterium AZCC 2161]